jgi:hypothetical protein
MTDSKRALKAYGGRCSHCGAHLEAGGPEGCAARCPKCGCIFYEGEIVAVKDFNTREPPCRIGTQELIDA